MHLLKYFRTKHPALKQTFLGVSKHRGSMGSKNLGAIRQGVSACNTVILEAKNVQTQEAQNHT